MTNKYSKCLNIAGATGVVLALTSGVANAVVIGVPVDELLSNSGYPQQSISFNPIGTNFVSGFDSTNFDAIVRNCGLSLIASGGMSWSESAVPFGGTVDHNVTFGNPGFPAVPADGDSVYYGYRFFDGVDAYNYRFAQFTGLATVSAYTSDFVFDAYSFEDSPDTGITVGAVPEPSMSAFFLALAASMFVVQRRKRS